MFIQTLFKRCMGKQLQLKKGLRLSFGLLLLATLFVMNASTSTVSAAPLLQTPPVISFSPSTYSITEGNVGNTTVTITAQMTGAVVTSPVTVGYTTIPGTATEGVDYLDATGTLTFTDIAPTQTFLVTVIGDIAFENSETVNLLLLSPQNATLGVSEAILTIQNDDSAPTATATPSRTPTPGGPIYVDAYEPNNSLSQTYTTAANANPLCNATLWPRGDEDFFRFSGKAGFEYTVFTSNLSAGLDTVLTVYNTQLVEIGSNDDADSGTRASEVSFIANVDGFYYARVINQDPTDPATKTYCFQVTEAGPSATQTPIGGGDGDPIGGDVCEFNSTFDYACEIAVGQTLSLNFVPTLGSERDTDTFKLWIKPGIQYTCETTIPTGSLADTNIILFNNNGQPFQPWIGNDDKQIGDFGSKVTYLSTYTGWLYAQVGPVNVPAYEESAAHTYSLICTATVATPTPTPSSTPTFAPVGGGGPGSSVATATPIIFPTFPPSPTPIDFATLFAPIPSPTSPSIQFQPLPTATPFNGGQQIGAINVTVYYDSNFNYMPELTEGIVDVVVALYDNGTGQLLALGYTNEAGMIHIDSITSTGAVRVVVPFLNYNQVVFGGNPNILLRIAPQPLPIGIP